MGGRSLPPEPLGKNYLRPDFGRATSRNRDDTLRLGEGRNRSMPIGREMRGRHGVGRANGMDGFRRAVGGDFKLPKSKRIAFAKLLKAVSSVSGL